jgi:hypothetical protein
MLDIADLVFEESDTDRPRSQAASPNAPVSPLRPWGMWSGWAAIGIACAGAVAHAVVRMGHSVGRTA